jgi:DNA polymerase I-like protein with 3'-5' exonuclease and polymerase domains
MGRVSTKPKANARSVVVAFDRVRDEARQLPDLAQYDEVSLDTEGTGVTVNDRAVGISLSTPDGRHAYFRWGHQGGGNNCTLEQVRNWASEQFSRPGLVVYMHNAGHDLRMLAYDGIRIRCRVEDTQVMAALLNDLETEFSLDYLARKHTGRPGKDDAKLNEWCAHHFGGAATRAAQVYNYWRAPGSVVWEYAVGDSDDTLAVAQVLRPRVRAEGLWNVYEMETALIPILLRMHLTGVPVDVERARAVSREIAAELAGLKAEWDRETGGANIGSTPQLAVLFDRWGLPYGRTAIGNASITAAHLKAVENRHPLVANLQRQKKLEKINGTFMQGHILGFVQPTGLVHTEFHATKKEWDKASGASYGAVSGRFSSANPNLQQIPKKDKELAKLVRGCFVPVSKEHRWVKLDYSQIEYRLLAHYAGGALRQAYLDNPMVDFHQVTADMTGESRDEAKHNNFGIVYGMGADLLASRLGCTLQEAKDIFTMYFEKVPDLKQIQSKANNTAADRGWLVTWGGRKRRFPPNPSYGLERTSRAGKKYRDRNRFGDNHKALNAILQGSAADMMKMALITVANEVIDWESAVLHLTVHDELDFSVVHGAEGDRYVSRIKEAMEDMTERGKDRLTVPIIAEADTGPDWGNLQPWKAAA